MSVPTLLPLALLAVAPILLAASPQDPSKTPATPQLAQVWNVSPSCPVAFSVRRQSPTEVVAVSHASQHTSGQGVHLSLDHPAAPAIVSAEVTVHAASNRRRYLPVQEIGPEPDLSRTFHLAAPTNAGELRTSNLWLDEAGSILSVDLLSLTYADGSVWKHNAPSSCHAIVSGYMLVSSR